jgi:DNA-binding XRE family transcriptional regulator
MTTKKRLKSILNQELGPMTFARFMRVARERCEMSQVEMAKELGISKGNLCDIEKGRQSVSPQLASKIAKAAGLSEIHAVETALRDLLKRSGLKMDIQVKVSGKAS